MKNGMRLKVYPGFEIFKFDTGERLTFIKFFCFFETRFVQYGNPFRVRQSLQLLNDWAGRFVLEPEPTARTNQTTTEKDRNRNVVPLDNGLQLIVTAVPVIQCDDQGLRR